VILLSGLRIIDCNQATLSLFGGDAADIVGKTVLDFSPPLQGAGEKTSDQAARFLTSTKEIPLQTFEWKHHDISGRPFDAEVRLKPFGSWEGETLAVAFVRDITARKKAEGERRAN